MFKYLAVGGRFDDAGGKPSGYMRKLYDIFQRINPNGSFVNGGSFTELTEILKNCGMYQVVFWMPDVPNDKEKLVDQIKRSARSTILVISKNNFENKYSIHSLIARSLKVKANLFVEFTNPGKNITAIVADPLGNCFCVSSDIDRVAATLMWRVSDLCKYTRMGSVPTSTCFDCSVPKGFLKLARDYAETFHELIHAENKDRLLGNLSFRCEGGFPSFRKDNTIFISKRNIDKREIAEDGFVPVELSDNQVLYGVTRNNLSVPPSVDTPVQLLLYGYYPRINFILHSHTYISGSVGTTKVIPCGAIEEFYEIIRLAPFRNNEDMSFNLKGHGSIRMGSSIESFRNIPYFARKVPEFHEDL